MKKLITLFVIVLFSASAMFAQEQNKVQKKTQVQEQTQAQTGEQSEDPIMTQERVRINEGQGTMTRAEKREMRKQNHGAVVSETAKNTEGGQLKGQTVSETAKQNRSGVQQHDRDRINFQAKPRTNRPAGFGVPQGAKPASPHRGGRR